MVNRVIMSMLMFVGVIALIFGVPTFPYIEAFCILLCLASAWEWSGFCFNQFTWRLSFVFMCTVLLLQLLPSFSEFIITLCAGLWALGGLRVYAFNSEQRQSALLISLSGMILISGFCMAIIELHQQSPLALLIMIIIVASNDILGLLVGRRFGKEKLCPLVSPNKTWEGLYGSLGGALVLAVVVWQLFDLPFSKVFSTIILVTFAAILGDLFVSCYKREAGMKDTGNLIPGHGGLLDRIDGMIAAAPVFWLLTTWADMHFVLS